MVEKIYIPKPKTDFEKNLFLNKYIELLKDKIKKIEFKLGQDNSYIAEHKHTLKEKNRTINKLRQELNIVIKENKRLKQTIDVRNN